MLNWQFKPIQCGADRLRIEIEWNGKREQICAEERVEIFTAKMRQIAESQLTDKASR
jgi:hypothetical protein